MRLKSKRSVNTNRNLLRSRKRWNKKQKTVVVCSAKTSKNSRPSWKPKLKGNLENMPENKMSLSKEKRIVSSKRDVLNFKNTKET